MKLTAHLVKLSASHGMFRIAREEITTFDGVVVELEHEGVVGIGEAEPSAYFDGETPAGVVKTVAKAAKLIGRDPFRIEDVTAMMAQKFPKCHSAQAAVDIALHDLVGKLLGVPLHKLLGLDPAKTKPTSFTLGIESPVVMAERAAQVKKFKVLKIKVGTKRDEEILKAIRGVTDMPIRVDANTGWSKEEAVRNIERLAKYDIQFVEQPIPAGDPEALRWIRRRSALPIMADEDSVNLASLPALVGCVDAVNVKLMKCGGIREAIRMIHFAHANGMKVMLGCMLETSVAIAAAANLEPMVEYVDLDGNFLIADDPFEGLEIRGGRHILPNRPGLGVKRRK